MLFNEYVSVLNSDIKTIKGIGAKKSEYFNNLGIYTVWDLIYFFPRNYEDRTIFCKIKDLSDDMTCAISAYTQSSVVEKRLNSKISLYILRVDDGTGVLNVKWFSSPFNKLVIKRGERYSFYGTVSSNRSNMEMTLKDMEPFGLNENIGNIIPVYSLTKGLKQKEFRKFANIALELLDDIPETLPQKIIDKFNLMPLWDAICAMHHPKDKEDFLRAKYRLAFEELFILSIAMKRIRMVNSMKTSVSITKFCSAREFAEKLPFALTNDQKQAINDICSDFKKNVSMNRLIQGDVGSGKTVVAGCAASVVVNNGYQVAVMAPTEILANQHYDTFCKFFKDTEIKVGLLTSSSKNKKEFLEQIKDGYWDIVIGTHALIQDNVEFKNLGLCITDEQHRFGVKQRAKLSDGCTHPHVLVMSATPIPRTLSLVVYGDLDISVIKSLPSGRQSVDTFWVNQSMRERVNRFIDKDLTEGYQCFVVCPLIETSENLDVNSGEEVYKNLLKRFPEYNIAFLHGKMKTEQKDEIMADFREKKYHILVSTTVIEVGIDIPNANLIIIENAERFGLSQLHQLRGRVGRGTAKSYCVLISDAKGDEAKERMKIMCTTSDGFEIANFDLKLRGSGEFFGTRQHGMPELKVANLFSDAPIISDAKRACDLVLSQDGNLESDSNLWLKRRIERMFEGFECPNIWN